MQVRHGGGGHHVSMPIRASQWEDWQLKELVFLHGVICLAPFVAIVAYANIFQGPAKLRPIPEGYEPKDYEYERHPISR